MARLPLTYSRFALLLSNLIEGPPTTSHGYEYESIGFTILTSKLQLPAFTREGHSQGLASPSNPLANRR